MVWADENKLSSLDKKERNIVKRNGNQLNFEEGKRICSLKWNNIKLDPCPHYKIKKRQNTWSIRHGQFGVDKILQMQNLNVNMVTLLH